MKSPIYEISYLLNFPTPKQLSKLYSKKCNQKILDKLLNANIFQKYLLKKETKNLALKQANVLTKKPQICLT